MNKKRQVHPSYVLRLAVFLGGLALLAWQGGVFPHTTLADMLPTGVVATVKPFFPLVRQNWRLSVVRHRSPAPVPAQIVRVRLFEDQAVRDFTVSSEGLQIGQRLIQGSLHVHRGGHGVVVTQGTRTFFDGPVVEIQPLLTSSILMLKVSAHLERRTSGILRIAALPNGLEIVNRIDLEDYVLGTVEPELGSMDLPVDAMKVQIIASRSYVLALHDRHPGKNYDFCDTAHCLMFTGVHSYPPRFQKAADESRGLYLSYKGHPAAAFFHHSCGGETAAVNQVWPVPPVPYLTRVVDGSPAYCRLGRWAEWNFTMERGSLRKCFIARGWIAPMESLESLQIIRKDVGGRAQDVLIQSSQPRWVDANEFRRAVNSYYKREVLYSTLFTITKEGNQFRFDGRGWGHGVGMCQSGAIHMARSGKTYQEILSHYYPGTTISQLSAATTPALKPDTRLNSYLQKVQE